jgi:2,3-bisphosphoglycerate-independent phosphoglycerate mutase
VADADGILVVTADHGNAEEKYSRDKKGVVQRDDAGNPVPRPSHSLNPVPFVICDPREALAIAPAEKPGLASVGGTVLELCGLSLPAGYLPGLVVPR